jgi:hypothetical protein
MRRTGRRCSECVGHCGAVVATTLPLSPLGESLRAVSPPGAFFEGALWREDMEWLWIVALGVISVAFYLNMERLWIIVLGVLVVVGVAFYYLWRRSLPPDI